MSTEYRRDVLLGTVRALKRENEQLKREVEELRAWKREREQFDRDKWTALPERTK